MVRPSFSLTSCIQRQNEIPATLREPAGPEDTPEKLEAERQAAQESIDNGQFLDPYRPLCDSLLIYMTRQPNRSPRSKSRRRKSLSLKASKTGADEISNSLFVLLKLMDGKILGHSDFC